MSKFFVTIFLIVFAVSISYINPADTGRKLNVHKTFTKRLLNVLCAFNLRLLSTGKVLRHAVFLLSLKKEPNKFYSEFIS